MYQQWLLGHFDEQDVKSKLCKVSFSLPHESPSRFFRSRLKTGNNLDSLFQIKNKVSILVKIHLVRRYKTWVHFCPNCENNRLFSTITNLLLVLKRIGFLTVPTMADKRAHDTPNNSWKFVLILMTYTLNIAMRMVKYSAIIGFLK